MDRLLGPPRAPPPPRAARSGPLGRCALPRRRRREIRLAGPPRARPPPPPLGSASLGCAAGMSGAAGRRREAVPRAGGVGGGGRLFFLIYQIFFTDQNFYLNFFSFDFDAIFLFYKHFLFSDANFFCSECKIFLFKISQFLPLKFLFLTFSRQNIFSLQNFS